MDVDQIFHIEHEASAFEVPVQVREERASGMASQFLDPIAASRATRAAQNAPSTAEVVADPLFQQVMLFLWCALLLASIFFVYQLCIYWRQRRRRKQV